MAIRTSTGPRVRRAPKSFNKGRGWAEYESGRSARPPSVISEVFEPATNITPGLRVFVAGRVSTKPQFDEGNHLSQLWRGRRTVERAGATVADEYGYCCQGYEPGHWRDVFARARAKDSDGVLFQTVNRALRNANDTGGWPTAEQLLALKRDAEEFGLRLFVGCDVTATDCEQEAYLARVGKRHRRCVTVGRPVGSKRKGMAELKEWVQWHREETSWTANSIAQLAMKRAERKGFKVSRQTIYRWVWEYDQECNISAATAGAGE